MAVDFGAMNPFSSIDIGIGTIGMYLLIFGIVVFIMMLIGGGVFMFLYNKKYYIKIPLYRNVGNVPTRVATYRAMIFPIGKAGDKLWYCRGIKKYLQPAIIQTAPNEFMHWEREDGEWINFGMGDLDHEQKKAGIKYIAQDMRSQRLATDKLLEQRLMKQGFWEKWGVVIGYVIFFLVISVAMVIIFYQFSKVVTQVGDLISKLDSILIREQKASGTNSIIPALLPLLLLPKMFFMEKMKW